MRAPLRNIVILFAILLASCQDPMSTEPDRALAASSRDQIWTVCRDPGRGLVAANACTQLLQSGQESGRALAYVRYNRGMALGRRGRTQDAIADYDAALAQDPFFALALYQRGLLYQQLGQQIRAEQDLQRARQIDPRLR